MHISANSLDDLLRRVLEKLLSCKSHINPTKGPATEMTCVLLKLSKPRARLSRTEMKGTLFSCLGELLWYLSKSNSLDFISYYLSDYEKFSDDGVTLHGGYGPRLFNKEGINQVENVIDLLKRKPESRQAVIQLFDAADIVNEYKDVPCTCTLQFMIRRGYLHMFTNMRSNDAFLGLPHDVFSFTMIQEILATSLSARLGTYNHAVGSLHLYKRDRAKAHRYIEEGWQSTISMPVMPTEDPWPSIAKLLGAESMIRRGIPLHVADLNLHPYWADLAYLLQIYSHWKIGERRKVARAKANLSCQIYEPYVRKRQAGRLVKKVPEQLPLIQE